MRIQLSDHFTYHRIIRFVMPSICMMIFTSIYGVVDGLFVSNFVGKTPFASLNLIMPFIMILGPLGFIIGTGGSAIVAKTLGEKEPDKANAYFSMMVFVTAVGGVVFAVLGALFMRPISLFLGATDAMVDYCVLYGNICMVSLPAFMLQTAFQSFMIAAEKPKLGLIITIISGCTNMVLDFLFIAVFSWGLAGAAWATACAEIVGGLLPVIYFACKNDSLLRLTKFRIYWRILGKTCVNGSSEFMSSISMSFVTALYNLQLLRFAGEDGVSAYGVMMYVNFIFMGVFFGYAMGIAPVVSYNFGAETHDEMKNVFSKSIKLMVGAGIALTILAFTLASPMAQLFVGYDAELLQLTCRGLRIYAICFILVGVNVFASSFFTALNNGVISAIISFLRSMVFKTAAVLILPVFWGIDGVWLSAIAAEILSFVVTLAYLVTRRHRYHYV